MSALKPPRGKWEIYEAFANNEISEVGERITGVYNTCEISLYIIRARFRIRVSATIGDGPQAPSCHIGDSQLLGNTAGVAENACLSDEET